MSNSRGARFAQLHASGSFVMPNPFDVGSARLLAAMGFEALATTSSGAAAAAGLRDGGLSRDALVDHVAAICAAVTVPVNVDAERCYPDDPGGVGVTVQLLAEAGAAGVSVEDWNRGTGTIEPIEVAVERVSTAVQAAHAGGLVLTARCEHHLRGVDDLDATIARLIAYRQAGADVLYAPGLRDVGAIRRLCAEVGGPVNVLALPGGPTVADLAAAGVRRISVGDALAWAAYGAVVTAARRLTTDGSIDPETLLDDDSASAFG